MGLSGSGACGLICWFIIVLVSLILLGCSFSVLEVNNVGLKYNSITKTYDSDYIYPPGRYFTGLGRKIVDFPTTWQKLDFCNSDCETGAAITGRVGVGASAVSVHLSMTVYYKLRIERLPEIISFFPTKNWEARYSTIVKNAVAVTMGSSQLTVEDFLTNRAYIQKAMGWAINERLQPVYGYVTSVFIREVALGSQAHSSIDQVYLDKQISLRRAITSSVEGQKQVIQAEASQQVSAIRALERQLIDNTYKATNFTVAEFAAKGDEMLLNAQGAGYLYLQAKLNLTQTDLIKFIYLDKVSSSMNHLVAGFDTMKYDALRFTDK